MPCPYTPVPKSAIAPCRIVEIRFLPPTRYKPARIKAIYQPESKRGPYTLTESTNFADVSAHIMRLVVRLIEENDLDFLRDYVDKMLVGAHRNGWIVAFPL